MIDINKLDIFPVGMRLHDPEQFAVLYHAHVEFRGESYQPYAWFSCYPITRYTACGVWIAQGIKRDKFVNLRALRQWASVTKEEAFFHLKKRKERHLFILNHQAANIKAINQYLESGSI